MGFVRKVYGIVCAQARCNERSLGGTVLERFLCPGNGHNAFCSTLLLGTSACSHHARCNDKAGLQGNREMRDLLLGDLQSSASAVGHLHRQHHLLAYVPVAVSRACCKECSQSANVAPRSFLASITFFVICLPRGKDRYPLNMIGLCSLTAAS